MKSIIEDLSLLSIMLDANDSQTFGLVLELISELKENLSVSNINDSVLNAQIEQCFALHKKSSFEELIAVINMIVPAAAVYCNSSTTSQTDTPSSINKERDISEELDQDLVSEFISSHTLELQDFENELIAHSQGDSSPEELESFTRYIKNYLHNIKGDAGSVGLHGISKIAHTIEDSLVDRTADTMTEQLLSFKEWVVECMESLQKGELFKRSSTEFAASLACNNVPSTITKPEKSELLKNQTIKQYKIAEEDDLLNDFLVEGEEHLGATESILLEQKEDYTLDDINTIFRAVHSIKGGAGYFNLVEVVNSSHTTETLLDKARSEETPFDTSLKELMIEYVDFQRSLFQRIRKAMEGDRIITPDPAIAQFTKRVESRLLNEPVLQNISTSEPLAQTPDTLEATTESNSIKTSAENVAHPTVKTEKRETVEYIKVDTKRLDKLLEYIGEMGTASSMLIRKGRMLLPENEDLNEYSHQLEIILREVQDIGMSLRLVPIKGLFQKMSRVVWDTAKKVNKPIEFHVEGEETELDRTLIERLADPLMHMVRNAVDHGIEPNELRATTNKSSKGNVTLRAYHKAGSIYVEIEDDGRGLDAKNLVNKAREKGIIENDRILTDEEAFALIFAPGFSTAAQVTDVSGRGVGMDVVRKNIESLRGKVTIFSTLGKGSTFRIELPLTLAIVDGIEIVVADQRYLFPTSAIVEIINLSPEMITSTLDRGETLRFRNQYLPLYPLCEILGNRCSAANPTDQTAVIVQNGNELAAFRIDDVLGQVSTVIKSLGSVFKDLPGLAGCAIMPDGKIGIILDVNGLIEMAQSKLSFSSFSSTLLENIEPSEKFSH